MLGLGSVVFALVLFLDFPAREVDRPLVVSPGMSELNGGFEYRDAGRFYDEDSRLRRLPGDASTSAALATAHGRYGLFRNLEVRASVPWTVRLDRAGGSTVSGLGRMSLGARYQMQPAPASFVAGEVAMVLPSTARRLRTAPDGTVQRDRLAIAGALHAKHVLLDASAAHASLGFVFPFANADDQEADRDPPATLFVEAGSTFQVGHRLWADASAAFTRTGREDVGGTVVPRSDQFEVALKPSAGIHVTRAADVSLHGSIPVAGRNTPQTFGAALQLRFRF